MVSDEVYELCLPILKDESVEEEDKTDQLLELLKQETPLTGSSLENAVLDVLWRFRESAAASPSLPPARHVVIRRTSPAPWQLQRSSTPLASSPMSGFSLAPPPGLSRVKSSTASPFASPKPSPRLAFASPRIPHSPDLNAYEFPSETSPGPDVSGEYGSDAVDWLVNDDSVSVASSAGATPAFENGLNGLNGASAPFFQPAQIDMGPYDMLRSVVGEGRSDEEIERALEANGYDLTAAIVDLMGEQPINMQPPTEMLTPNRGTILVGKSMATHAATPMLAGAQPRSGIVCKYFLSSGACLRDDCRFSHDLSSHVCKYWLMGNCLAGDTCVFSHDPSSLINRLSVEDSSMFGGSSPPAHHAQPNFQIQDYNSFPALQQLASSQLAANYHGGLHAAGYNNTYHGGNMLGMSPGSMGQPFVPGDASFKRPRSRPSSRHSRAATPSIPSVDDPDAFPTLGASKPGPGKKNQAKRGGHGNGYKDKETVPSTLAGIVRMAPSPKPGQSRPTSKAGNRYPNSREHSAAAQAIPAPQHIPWLETGERANKAYLKARQEAIKHGALRNKFLQSAAQAWHRNDARAAKALSLRGQSENEQMRQAHREAARQLHEKRNSNGGGSGTTERYIDLHCLHPNEVVEYLEPVLVEYRAHQAERDPSSSSPPSSSSSSSSSSSTKRAGNSGGGNNNQYVYIITGTGHHSRNSKDKLGKTVRSYLNELGYAYREFSVPGDRNQSGGILGIDPRSYDKEKVRGGGGSGGGVAGEGEDSNATGAGALISGSSAGGGGGGGIGIGIGIGGSGGSGGNGGNGNGGGSGLNGQANPFMGGSTKIRILTREEAKNGGGGGGS